MTLPIFRTPRAKTPVWPILSGNAVFWLFGVLEAGLWEAWDGVFFFFQVLLSAPCLSSL